MAASSIGRIYRFSTLDCIFEYFSKFQLIYFQPNTRCLHSYLISHITKKEWFSFIYPLVTLKQLLQQRPFIMKTDYSKHGLSQIIEESDREDSQHPSRQLAKLSNLEFLSQYVHLNPISEIRENYEHLLDIPLNPYYSRFVFDQEKDSKNAKRQLQQNMTSIQRAQMGVLSKEQLKLLAAKSLEESQSRDKLSTSRKQKREVYFEQLKTSRRFNSERLDKSASNFQSIERIDSIMQLSVEEPSIKDASTSQSVQDLFIMIARAGEERDYIKKQWYFWGERAKGIQKKSLIDSWVKIHQHMKKLVEQLMQKMTAEVGSSEIFRQLRIQNNLLLSKKIVGSKSKKTLVSTQILSPPTPAQTKIIVRFNQWFNKLLLDQRQLEFINSQHSKMRTV